MTTTQASVCNPAHAVSTQLQTSYQEQQADKALAQACHADDQLISLGKAAEYGQLVVGAEFVLTLIGAICLRGTFQKICIFLCLLGGIVGLWQFFHYANQALH